MSDALLPIGGGHTELTDEEYEQLIPTYIATRGDLYDAEQRNIAAATLGRRPPVADLLEYSYLTQLHAAMFGSVWKWAGQPRKR